MHRWCILLGGGGGGGGGSEEGRLGQLGFPWRATRLSEFNLQLHPSLLSKILTIFGGHLQHHIKTPLAKLYGARGTHQTFKKLGDARSVFCFLA